MQAIFETLTSPKNLPEVILWGATALAIAGFALSLFQSGLLAILFATVGGSLGFTAHLLHITPDLSSHVTSLKNQLEGLEAHLTLTKAERNKLQAEIQRLMTAGTEIERNVARLREVTHELEVKQFQLNDLLLRYEATAQALSRIEGRLDAGVTRLHNEVHSLSLLPR